MQFIQHSIMDTKEDKIQLNEEKKIKLKGSHLILDCLGGSAGLLSDKVYVSQVLEELVNMLQMRKLINPIVVHCDNADHDWDKGGVSGFVIIAESHISIHTFPDAGLLTADVYSCKPFDEDLVKDFVKTSFKISKVQSKLIGREIEFLRNRRLLEFNEENQKK